MASHYRDERITELLNIIASMEKKLDALEVVGVREDLAHAYTTIVLAKAKLTALQGEKE
jgi:hypothetical protein